MESNGDAGSLLLSCIRFSFFPVISSFAMKNFSNALEMLQYVFVHFSIYLVHQHFRFDLFTL